MALDETDNLIGIPPEMWGEVFQLLVQAQGLASLPPLALVCRAWSSVIASSPRLWGIITLSSDTRPQTLFNQLVKSRASPLQLNMRRHYPTEVTMLTMLAHVANRWEKANVTTDVLKVTKWEILRYTLRILELSPKSIKTGDDPGWARQFFGGASLGQGLAPPKLWYFSATSLPSSWVSPFLSSSITFLRLANVGSAPSTAPLRLSPDDILGYLSAIPNVVDLELDGIQMVEPIRRSTNIPPISLRHLTTLIVAHVNKLNDILSHVLFPTLQKLSITQPYTGDFYHADPGNEAMSPLFAHWSQLGDKSPRLRALSLQACMKPSDAPYLIRWLDRLPTLVRLVIADDAISSTVQEEVPGLYTGNIFQALADPDGLGEGRGWICPILSQLRVDLKLQIKDLFPVAWRRGKRNANQMVAEEDSNLRLDPNDAHSPNSLSLLEAPLCPSEEWEEMIDLMNVTDGVACSCLACHLQREFISPDNPPAISLVDASAKDMA